MGKFKQDKTNKALEEDSKEKSVFLSLHSPGLATGGDSLYLRLTQSSSTQVKYRDRVLPRALLPLFIPDLLNFKQQTKQTLVRHTPRVYLSCLGDGGSREVTTSL